MINRRNTRQNALREIVRNSSVRTQRELVDQLKDQGFKCTQATVSRDIADMGLRKLSDGVYVLAEDLHLQRMVSEFVTDIQSANNLVVVKTQPGTAPGVGTSIDAAALNNVIGTVASNDTALVVLADATSAENLVRLVNKLRSSDK